MSKLSELVKDWRAIAHQFRYNPAAMPFTAEQVERCANELESALQSPQAEIPGLPELISALQSMRDRLLPVLAKKFGDGFDGDMDTLLEAANVLKRINGRTCAAMQTKEVPYGYALVPLTATRNMLSIGRACYNSVGTAEECMQLAWRSMIMEWQASLERKPVPPSQKQPENPHE